MENRWQRLLTKFLWSLAPVMNFISAHVNMPYIFKKVTGQVYYAWKPKLRPGMVFITNIFGEGSNLINPSPGKHGAIYFGTGLRTALDAEIMRLSLEGGNLDKIDRLAETLKHVEEHVPYVLEAVREGVLATDVVSFFTNKDRIRAYRFWAPGVDPKTCLKIMSEAASVAMLDLGLPYDYGFTDGDDARYCFELVAHAYKTVRPETNLPRKTVLGHVSYQCQTFMESKDFLQVLDSDSY